MNYVDGFVHPISEVGLPAYRSLVKAIAKIWKEHGALDYQEFIGDDLTLEGTRNFAGMLEAKPGEIIVFGFVSFSSREVRDLANKKVANDPRVSALVESSNCGFDPSRMAYGGFKSL